MSRLDEYHDVCHFPYWRHIVRVSELTRGAENDIIEYIVSFTGLTLRLYGISVQGMQPAAGGEVLQTKTICTLLALLKDFSLKRRRGW